MDDGFVNDLNVTVYGYIWEATSVKYAVWRPCLKVRVRIYFMTAMLLLYTVMDSYGYWGAWVLVVM